MICPSLNDPPNAGMAPVFPFLIRSMMNSSLRFVPASFGPFPAVRPPFLWQKPHTVANRAVSLSSPSLTAVQIGLIAAWRPAGVKSRR
jgi:hypothetical protein